MEDFMKPIYTATADDELLKKKKENSDKMENKDTPQNDAFELLNKTIQSNEKNTSSIQEFVKKQTESICMSANLDKQPLEKQGILGLWRIQDEAAVHSSPD